MSDIPYGAGYVARDGRNRFNQFVARRYKDKNVNGNSNTISLGAYRTREEAAAVLLQYQDYAVGELLSCHLTFKEVYESFKKHNTHYSKGSLERYDRAFRYCARFHNVQYQNLTCSDMISCIDGCENYSQKSAVKSLFVRLDEEAMIQNIPGQRTAVYLGKLHPLKEDINHRETHIFTDDEVELFRAHASDPYMDMVLVLLYTGLRENELLHAKKANVFLDKKYFVAGSKTKAGIDRKIPIHPYIEPIIRRWMEQPGEYLYSIHEDKPTNTSTLYRYFKLAIAPYAPGSHHPHEARHTFATRLVYQGVPEYTVDRIIGHKVASTLYRIYCHTTIDELYKAILKLW